jgi:hypothetical protein
LDQTLKTILISGVSAAALLFGAGYAVGYKTAPREILDSQVKSSGFFGTETKRVLSATVTSLRSESQLVVYRFAGETRVSIAKTALGGLFKGAQELIVPATVMYFLDMRDLNEEDVTFDERSKTVLVRLPPLKLGDVAFDPARARQLNSGFMTWNDGVVRELERLNYGQARVAFIKMAQLPAIGDNAKRQAEQNVKSYFEIPLRIVGETDVKVRAYFPKPEQDE